MKNTGIILAVILAISITAYSQIPNGGFETWENYYDGSNVYEKPDFWNGSLPYSPLTHSYSLEKHPESYPAGTRSVFFKNPSRYSQWCKGCCYKL